MTRCALLPSCGQNDAFLNITGNRPFESLVKYGIPTTVFNGPCKMRKFLKSNLIVNNCRIGGDRIDNFKSVERIYTK